MNRNPPSTWRKEKRNMATKKAAVLLAEGFEETEAVSIIDVLRRAQVETFIVSVSGAGPVTGAHDIRITADRKLEELDVGQLDAVVLPGGMPGAANLAGSEAVRELLRKAAAADLVIGAICAGPIALAAAGVIKGRRATCYPGFEDRLNDAQVTGARVETDGRVVTGKGPGAALEFGLGLLEALDLDSEAGQLKEAMLVR